MRIVSNLEALKQQVDNIAKKSGRNPSDIRIVAVSKRQSVEKIIEAYDAGHRIFGENRVDEALEKFNLLKKKPIEWHMIGHLQKNKVKKACEFMTHIHSLDSVDLAGRIQTVLKDKNKIIHAFIQVKLSEEDTKTGLSMNEVSETAEKIREFSNIKVIGLMTMPPFSDNPEDSAPYFSKLREIKEHLNNTVFRDNPIQELSMGMSNDFKVAVREGATYIRVGTMIFGERAYVCN